MQMIISHSRKPSRTTDGKTRGFQTLQILQAVLLAICANHLPCLKSFLCSQWDRQSRYWPGSGTSVTDLLCRKNDGKIPRHFWGCGRFAEMLQEWLQYVGILNGNPPAMNFTKSPGEHCEPPTHHGNLSGSKVGRGFWLHTFHHWISSLGSHLWSGFTGRHAHLWRLGWSFAGRVFWGCLFSQWLRIGIVYYI